MAASIYGLHALAVSPEMWDDVRDAAPDLPFVAPDLCEVLEEGRFEGNLAGFVNALAQRAPEGELVLVGASIGAHFALELAAHLGERVRACLLIVPGPARLDDDFHARANAVVRTLRHAWTEEMARNFVKLLVYPFGRRQASVAARVERMLNRYGPRAAPLVGLSPGFRDAAELLPRLHGPVRVLIAADNSNPIQSPGVAEQWRQLLGAGAVERVDSASEFLPMERPEVVVRAIRELLGQRS